MPDGTEITVQQAPPHVAAPIDPDDGTPPAGWSPGQWHRVRKAEERMRLAEARVKELEPVASRVTGLESDLRSWQHRHAAETAMLSSDRPALRDPEVRAFVLERYEAAHRDTAADKRPAFGEWFTAQCEKPGALLAPYLKAPEATTTAATQTTTTQASTGATGTAAGAATSAGAGTTTTATTVAAPNPNIGVRDTPLATGRQQAILEAYRTGSYGGAMVDEDIAAAVAAGAIRPPRGWKPPTT